MTPKRIDTAMAAGELKRITDDNEPLRRVLAMQRAINTFLEDVATDEPVTADEGPTGPELDAMIRQSAEVVKTLSVMFKRVRR